ncbi:MAG: DinB family protein [Anaerolineales bacterium]|jgi:hypothetical protein
MEANRKHWNQQHAVLQRLLMKEKNLRKALSVALSQHAAVHSAGLPPLPPLSPLREDRREGSSPRPNRAGRGREDKHAGAHWSFQDEVLGALTEAQMRAIPKRGQSVVWKIWHSTRVEDVTMNLLLASSPQVLLKGNWPLKLGIGFVDVGNDMPEADLKKLSESINLKALLAYRLAVGKRTRSILRRLKPDDLWEKPAPERIDRIVAERAVREKARWLLKYWGENPSANLLLMPATRHPFVHFNEISRMIPSLRKLRTAK